jgi:hypothetical protein
MRRSVLVAGFLTTLLLACPAGALSKSRALPELPAQVTAALYGQPIPLKDVVNHHCHDLDMPTIRCFDTAEERDGDAMGLVSEGLTLQPLSLLNLTYALVYTAPDYGGSSMLISSPVPDLGVLGWNNVISSFKSTNGGRPKWWANANYGGDMSQWAASAWVPYVGDDVDNTFSSVKNVP